MKTTLAATLLATLVLFPHSAEAKVRCGQMLAKPGDSRGFVAKHCGKPDQVVQLVNGMNAPVGERWYYYKTGYNAKTITVTFRNGVVRSANETLD